MARQQRVFAALSRLSREVRAVSLAALGDGRLGAVHPHPTRSKCRHMRNFEDTIIVISARAAQLAPP
jgi:hypothetical protein